MSTALRVTDLMTPEEYLEFEEGSDIRHEYVGGLIFAMAGASVVHGIISGNIFANLHAQLRGTRCRPFVADVRHHVRAHGDEFYYYPDVMVACDPSDQATHSRERPSVIFEVLSPSTSQSDRQKFYFYQANPALEVFALVEQSWMEVTVYRRVGGEWKKETLARSEEILRLPTIGCDIPLSAIYEGVTL